MRNLERENRILQVGVKAFLRNNEGKYLILKRSAAIYPDIKNLWDIPGGRIETGSGLLENLSRELKEETGLELVGSPKLIAAQDILKEDRHIIRLTYIAEANGTPVLENEHEEYSWLSKQELEQMVGLDSYAKEVLNFLP